MSEDLCVLLPSLDGVKGALSMAKSWLIKSKPYLVSDLSVMQVANSLLKVEDLQVLCSIMMVILDILHEWFLTQFF